MLYISLGIELLILICLSYIQWYRLCANSQKQKYSPDIATDKTDNWDKLGQLSVEALTEISYLPGIVSKDYPEQKELRDKPKNSSNGHKPLKEIPFDGMATSSPQPPEKKKAPSNKNGARRKRLSQKDKEAIRYAFTELEEGKNIKELVEKLAKAYKVSKRTIYRTKGDG